MALRKTENKWNIFLRLPIIEVPFLSAPALNFSSLRRLFSREWNLHSPACVYIVPKLSLCWVQISTLPVGITERSLTNDWNSFLLPTEYNYSVSTYLTFTVCRFALWLLINPLNAELNPIRHLLALVGARHIVHVSRIRVNVKRTPRNQLYCIHMVNYVLPLNEIWWNSIHWSHYMTLTALQSFLEYMKYRFANPRHPAGPVGYWLV